MEDLTAVFAGVIFTALGIYGLDTGIFRFGGPGNRRRNLLTGEEATPDHLIYSTGRAAKYFSILMLAIGVGLFSLVGLDHLGVSGAKHVKAALLGFFYQVDEFDDANRKSPVGITLHFP